jgi:ABC-type dipeptide/oligopeptide/nickel transport system permease subunit
VIVAATFGIANDPARPGLSFLGLGIQPPTRSWGNMLKDYSRSRCWSRCWLWIPRHDDRAAVLSINFIGDGLRDARGSALSATRQRAMFVGSRLAEARQGATRATRP